MSDAIMATGRSDYPNQIDNVLGFPYIYRGASDVRARAIDMEMKIAPPGIGCAGARGACRRSCMAYGARPNTDPTTSFRAVQSAADLRIYHGGAKAAMESKVARAADPGHGGLSPPIAQPPRCRSPACCKEFTKGLRPQPRRVVFAEGEEEQVIRAAASFVHEGLGTALFGRPRTARARQRTSAWQFRGGQYRNHQCRHLQA